MRYLETRLLLPVLVAGLAMVACGENAAPVAPLAVSAGPDRTVVWPAHPQLDGSVIHDRRGDSPLSAYALWTFVSGPGSVTFRPDFVAATSAFFSRPGTYVLRLTGGQGDLSASDEVTVIAEHASSNQPPIVEAVDDQVVSVGTAAELMGVVWDDALPAGPDALKATWSQLSGPAAATIEDAGTLKTQLWLPAAGSYTFGLNINDGELTAGDEVVFTASPPQN